GQERVLYRAEQGGLRADQKQRREEPAEIAREKTPGREHHHRDLEDFHPADQVGLLVLVGDLPGGGREQYEGQDEETRGKVHDYAAFHPPEPRAGGGEIRALVGDEDDEGVLDDVAVERAEELHQEERRETALREQRK